MWWWRVYAALVFLLIAASIYTLSVSVWRGPWRDMWEVAPFLEKAMTGAAGWSDYWEQYGFSHRPLMSRWFWVADLRWFSGSNHLLLAISLLMQALIFFVVRAVLLRDSTFTLQQRRIVLLGVVFCLLNITQAFNFLHTFDVQWFLVTGLCVFSLASILYAAESRNIIYLAVGWLAIFLASLNNFSGLVMWPVAMLLLIGLRFSFRHVLIFFMAFCAYLPVYFYQLIPTDRHAPTSIYTQVSFWQWIQFSVLVLVKFPLSYLSNPLSYQLSTSGPLRASLWLSWLAPGAMCCLLLAAARCWWLGVFRIKKFSSVVWLGLALILFGYGVGVATAIGRIVFWDNVYALRYQNIVLLFWIGVVLWFAGSVRWRNMGLVLGSVLLLVVFATQVGWYHDLTLKTGNRTRNAHLALVVGLEDQLSAISATVSRSHLGKDSTYTLQREAAFLRARHTGAFADPAWSNFPALLSLQLSPVCATEIAGSDVRGSDDSYARLSIAFREPVSYDVIVWYDNSDVFSGLLIAAAADTWWQRLHQSLHGFTDYVGFAKQLPKQKPVAVFARTGERWCRLVF